MPEKNKKDVSSPSSLSSTRQLLDELDALMDQMLALPVGEGAPEGSQETGSAVGVADYSASNAVEASDEEPNSYEPLNLDDELESDGDSNAAMNYFFDEPQTDSAPADQKESTESVSSARDGDWLSDEPEAESGDLSFGPQPIGGELFSYLQESKKPDKKESELKATGVFTPTVRRELVWWLRPLAWFNRAFDAVTYIFGPFGEWLREPGGRTFLGLLGITLILAATTIQILLWLTWN